LVGSTVGKVCFVSYFILQTAKTVDACAITSIPPSLSLTHMIYFTADTKATPASVQCFGLDFQIVMYFAFPQYFETCS